MLGHGNPAVLAAAQEQMQTQCFVPPMHAVADVTLEFNKTLASVAPEGLSYVKGFSGGSEAMESAIKFTRQYFKQTGNPGKYKFVSRYSSYHGGVGFSMAASGTGWLLH